MTPRWVPAVLVLSIGSAFSCGPAMSRPRGVEPSSKPVSGVCRGDPKRCAAADSAARHPAILAELAARQQGVLPTIRPDRTKVIAPAVIREVLSSAPRPVVPIPDRILVKIAATEVRDVFPRRGTRSELGGLDAAFNELRIRDVEFLGTTAERQVLLGLRFAEPQPATRVRAVIGRARARAVQSLLEASAARPMTRATVVLSTAASAAWLQRFEPTYEQLKPTSYLGPAFRRLGVLSIRRVFRGVEKAVANRPDQVRVHPFRDVLDAAKRAYPGRASRAYRTIETSPSGTALRYPDPGGSSARMLGSIAVRDRITGPVRSGEGYLLSVPDNMENWFILRLRPGTDLGATISELSRLSIVERVTLDYPVTPAMTQDPEYPDQWGLKNTGSFQGATGGLVGFDINIEPAWSVTPSGQPVVVGVIDTGLNPMLDELRNRLWTNSAEASGTPNVDDDCNGYIDDVHGITTYDRWIVDYGPAPCGGSPGGAAQVFTTHGTMVAGVIAAQTGNSIGIAGTAGTDNVQLMDIVLGTFSGNEFPPGFAEVSEALAYAISPSYEIGANVAALPPGADVVNMSFTGGGCQYLFEEILFAALDNGLVLVGAAGNDDRRFVRSETLATGVFPASLPGVIAVGGAARTGQRYALSNYGPGLDLVAPAADIRTITFNIANVATQTAADLITNDGTSFSAAYVSGAAAVILARHSYVTAPYMEHWLRAKARDMTDPNGDGTPDPGEDEWSGAGMLDVGRAVTTLTNPNDQPLEIAIAVERAANRIRYAIGMFPPHRPMHTGGSPDVGVRVQGSTLQNWELYYGQGDAPTTWTQIPVSSVSTTQPRDFTLQWAYGNADLTGGINDFDTDGLTNKQVYTLKLVAYNRAGTAFTAYDWFVPARASLTFPETNWILRPEEGWLPLGGYVDARANATYAIDVVDATDQTVWSGTFPPPYQPSSAPWGPPQTDILGYALIGGAGSSYFMPAQFPDLSTLTAEGWYKFRLRVNGSARTDEDSVRVFVDRSSFPTRFWPLVHSPANDDPVYDVYIEYYTESLKVLDEGGAGAARLLVKTSKTVFALDQAGALIWDHVPRAGPPYQYFHRFSPNLVAEDIDGDGVREVVFTANERRAEDWETRLYVYVLNVQTGQTMSSAWPLELEGYGAGVVAAGDITGDARKEIIVTLPRQYYVGVSATDVSGPELRVFDHAGNHLWTHVFPVELWELGEITLRNVDGGTKDEIIIGGTGQILRGDHTFVTGWSTGGSYAHVGPVQRAVGQPDIIMREWTSRTVLRDAQGVDRPGWPLTLTGRVITGQVVPGGDEEIIVCGTALSVIETSGTRPATWSDVTLDGICDNVVLADVDSDGVSEFVVLIRKNPATPALTEKVGAFLEAYELDGTRLAATDARWPHPVSLIGFSGPADLHRQVTIGDVDADGRREIVQLLPSYPWTWSYEIPSARIGVVDLP